MEYTQKENEHLDCEIIHVENKMFVDDGKSTLWNIRIELVIIISDIELFSQQHWQVMKGKAQVSLIILTMAPFYSSVPVCHDSVTVSQYARYKDPETEAAKWNSAVIHFIIYTCAYPAVTHQIGYLLLIVTL